MATEQITGKDIKNKMLERNNKNVKQNSLNKNIDYLSEEKIKYY